MPITDREFGPRVDEIAGGIAAMVSVGDFVDQPSRAMTDRLDPPERVD